MDPFAGLAKVNILLYLFLVRKISCLVSSLPSQYIYPIDADSQSSEKMMKTNHSTKSPLEPLQSFSSLASHRLKTTTMLCLRFSLKFVQKSDIWRHAEMNVAKSQSGFQTLRARRKLTSGLHDGDNPLPFGNDCVGRPPACAPAEMICTYAVQLQVGLGHGRFWSK